jgi:hypothetical protein
MFYGGYALQAAHEAAVSGDIINLSGGGFSAVEITKSVVLRGVGISGEHPTYIINELKINIPEDDFKRFSMEGIFCGDNVSVYETFCNPSFIKCQFQGYVNFQSSEKSRRRSSLFVNCKLVDEVYLYGRDDAQFINCYINNFITYNGNNASGNLSNCIITGSLYLMESTQIINSIFCCKGIHSEYLLPSTAIVTSCVSVNEINDIFKNVKVKTGCIRSKYSDVFKDFDGTYSDTQTFELTEDAKTTMLGTDGTQVGLYGGILPYDPTPSYPHITKMNVANRATSDGKLNVEIEVSAAK